MKWVLAIWTTVLATTLFQYLVTGTADVGITYGRNGSNVPSPAQVVDFLTNEKNNVIPLVRLLDADIEVLEAFRGTNSVLIVSVPNEDVPLVASSLGLANKWVGEHIVPFIVNQENRRVRIRYLSIGNEFVPCNIANLVIPAMKFVSEALSLSGVPNDTLKVTTTVSIAVLGKSFPPSAGQFEPSVASIMEDVTKFVYANGAPLLINVYPYFALVTDPKDITIEYALFQSKFPVIIDGDYKYYNLFDAMVDSFVVAMERVVGKEDVRVVVSETGWPIKGNEPYASIYNAQTYNSKLIDHVRGVGATPRKSDYMEVYIYSMFNEDKKPDPVGRNFGTFNNDFTEVYPLWH